MPEEFGSVTTYVQDAASGNNLVVSASGAITANVGTTNGLALDTTLQTINIDLGIINANLTNGNQQAKLLDSAGVNQAKVLATGELAVYQKEAVLWVTATGAAAAAVTLTLPAVASQFHRLCHVEIEAYSTVARVGGVTPVLVASTNLPGSPVWTFASAAAIGSTDMKLFEFSAPVKASAVNTATTIVCPATTSVIWRVNVSYYTAA